MCLCVLKGGRDHEDYEGLHQHDRQEALQRHVRHQHRQRLDQVIRTRQSDWGLVRDKLQVPVVGKVLVLNQET